MRSKKIVLTAGLLAGAMNVGCENGNPTDGAEILVTDSGVAILVDATSDRVEDAMIGNDNEVIGELDADVNSDTGVS